MQFKLTFFSFFFFLSCLANLASAIEFRVLQFNIWQEGTVVKGGFEAIADEIIANKADIVTFSGYAILTAVNLTSASSLP